MIDIDAKGTWNVSRAAYHARLKDHGGQILNISATLHYGGTPGRLTLAAAKAGVDALTRTLAVEWGAQGIGSMPSLPVLSVIPKGRGDSFPARRRLVRERFPAPALGAIEDIVDLALFGSERGRNQYQRRDSGFRWRPPSRRSSFWCRPARKAPAERLAGTISLAKPVRVRLAEAGFPWIRRG